MATRRGDLRVLRGTTIHGPMTRDQLAGLVAAGRVAGTDLVSVAEGPWSPVAAYLGGGSQPEAGDHRVEGVGTAPTPSPSPWHYARGGSQFGPVSGEQLKELVASGNLSPIDLIWREGLPDWRPASTLRGLFPEAMTHPAGPPPLPTAPPAAASEPSSQLGSGDPSPSPSRKPDFFDRARDLTLKAKAKAEAFQREAQAKAEAIQKEAQAKAEKMRQDSLTSPAQEALSRGMKAAVDYARSDEAKELARKARETAKGGVVAAALAGLATAGGREQIRRAAEHPLGIAAALLCFFPLGLYLVWHHPQWTRPRKWAWTGAWLGCFLLLMLPALLTLRTRPAEYEAVDHPQTRPLTNPVAGRAARGPVPGTGVLASFEDHPPPIVTSLSLGQEVWILVGCRTNTASPVPEGDRYALYVVLRGDELLSIAIKEYHHQQTSWRSYPSGEFATDQVRITWEGRKEDRDATAPAGDPWEEMVLTERTAFQGADRTASGAHGERSSVASIAIRWTGDDARWELEATSSSALVGGKGPSLPSRTFRRRDSGSGRRLLPGESGVRNSATPQSGGTSRRAGGLMPDRDVGTPAAARLAKREFIARIDALGNPCRRTDLLRVTGEPVRTQTFDGVEGGVFWYFPCRDGMVQVELLNPKAGIGEHNDESLAYISRINDY